MRRDIAGGVSAATQADLFWMITSGCGLKIDPMTRARTKGGRPVQRLWEYSRPQGKVALTRVETEEVERRKILGLRASRGMGEPGRTSSFFGLSSWEDGFRAS